MQIAMLTTFDNPFSPFDQYEEWFVFDTAHGYNTEALLGRIVQTSFDLAEADQMDAVNDAIDDIVRENFSGMHRKVTKEIEGSY